MTVPSIHVQKVQGVILLCLSPSPILWFYLCPPVPYSENTP